MRLYGAWGSFHGTLEDPQRCIAEVSGTGCQCKHARGFGGGLYAGLLCGSHERTRLRGNRGVLFIPRDATAEEIENAVAWNKRRAALAAAEGGSNG